MPQALPFSVITDTARFFPPNLVDNEIYPKLTAMMNHILTGAVQDLADVKYKWTGPQFQRQEVIQAIIIELGFEYISSVMDTITNFEFNTLLQFLSLINLLKGSLDGLSLVLILLGFDSSITEWWQQNPKHTPYTYDITVLMDSSRVADVFATLEKVRVFAREYVFPIIENIDFRFSISFAERNIMMAGFAKPHYAGTFMRRA